jgi:curved DNA-binding protein
MIPRMTRTAGAMTVGQARELLGLPLDAGAEATARAYRTAVKTAHPDLGGDPERLRLVIEAHQVLKSLDQARMMFPPAPTPRPPGEQTLQVKITLREAMAGGRRRLKLKGGKTLDVRLPKGLRPGEALRLSKVSASGGDVLVQIAIRSEAGLSIQGDDLWLEVSAAAGQIQPGARFEVDTPHGRRALVAPEGAAEGRPIRLKGQGLPARGERPAGDLILKLIVDPAARDAPAREPASKKLLRRFSARWAA